MAGAGSRRRSGSAAAGRAGGGIMARRRGERYRWGGSCSYTYVAAAAARRHQILTDDVDRPQQISGRRAGGEDQLQRDKGASQTIRSSSLRVGYLKSTLSLLSVLARANKAPVRFENGQELYLAVHLLSVLRIPMPSTLSAQCLIIN